MKKYQFLFFLFSVMSLSACSLMPTAVRSKKPSSSSNEGINSLASDLFSEQPSESSYESSSGIDYELEIDEANQTATYGFYPQSRVSDESLIAELEVLSDGPVNDFGWRFYNGKFYVEEIATPFDFAGEYGWDDAYFADGTTIRRGTYYWFECEPITWKILEEQDDEYYLLSEYCLDISAFNTTGQSPSGFYPNSWETSTLREFLNDEFYYKAFCFNNDSIIQTEIDNSASTTGSANNRYASDEPTYDCVFCPSYQDYNNREYGFTNDNSRLCYTTDYGRARGVYYEMRAKDREFYGDYYTRSPDTSSSNVVRVSERGNLWTIDVKDEFGSVRPAIKVSV